MQGTFWAASSQTGNVYQFDLATGKVLTTFQAPIPQTPYPGHTSQVYGLLVYGQPRSVPNRPIIFVHGINEDANQIGVSQPDPTQDEDVPIWNELTSVYGSTSITAFKYVDDLSLADNGGCPAGVYPPCKSQSAVFDNAKALALQIQDLYTQTNHAVTLIGYSMGAAIIRTTLAGCPDGQGLFYCQGISDEVDTAFFLNGVQQGSWLLQVQKGLDASSALPGLGGAANGVANALYDQINATLNLDPRYPAERDLTPLSTNIQAVNTNFKLVESVSLSWWLLVFSAFFVFCSSRLRGQRAIFLPETASLRRPG